MRSYSTPRLRSQKDITYITNTMTPSCERKHIYHASHEYTDCAPHGIMQHTRAGPLVRAPQHASPGKAGPYITELQDDIEARPLSK